MSKKDDNAAMIGIIVGLLSCIGLGVGLYNLFGHNDWAAIIGVIIGIVIGFFAYNGTK